MNVDVFTEWLFRGLGRAYLHLQNHDSTPFHDALLQASLYNPVYDRQSEGTRTSYLFHLMELTPHPAFFQAPILHALAYPDDEMDFEQLFDFACIFAKAGHPTARELMYKQFADYAGDGNDTGAEQLIDLDGIDGFRFVAARLGEAAQADPDFWDSARLLNYLKESTSGTLSDRDIADLGSTNPSIQRYLDVVAETEARRLETSQNRNDLRSIPYAILKEHLLAHDKRLTLMQLRRWGQNARPDDLNAAASDLLQQDDPRMLTSYLAIFARRIFPHGFQPLLPFVRHTNDRIVQCTLDALSLFRHPQLRHLGLELVDDNWHSSNALTLFTRNYQPGDEHLFIALLQATQSTDEIHALGFGLLDILAENSVVQAFEVRRLLYERQPCSLCRTNVVRQLVTTQTIPAWMQRECQFDVSDETRELVGSLSLQDV